MKLPVWLYPSLGAPRGIIGATARRAAYVALAALVISCGENPAAPSVARRPAIPLLLNPDIVVMERTTDILAHDGVAAVHLSSTETLTGQVRAAPQRQLPRAVAHPAVSTGVAYELRPPISLPARYETAMCSALPEWRQTLRADVSNGGSADLVGVGDAPASIAYIMQDGRAVATVEWTWVRTSISWQLVRQTTTTVDGRYRDVVKYEHRTASGQTVHNALPMASCVTPRSATVTSSAMASRNYYPRPDLGFLAVIPAAQRPLGLGDSCYEGGYDPCFGKQMDVYRAYVAIAIAATAVTIACLPPAVVLAAPCGIAVTAYLATVAYAAIAQAELNNCRQEQADRRNGIWLSSVTTGAIGTLGVSVPRGTAGVTGVPRTFAIDACNDDGSAGTYWNGGTAQPSCGYEAWEVSYDGGMTWQYLGTFWVCNSA